MIAHLRPERFQCRGDWLVGILHLPVYPRARGVLVITGGPQYRAGSHRQFVLLGQLLAESGIPVLRFDHRGMGDSEGDPRSFDQLNADLGAAVRHFFQVMPNLRELVLWGLCDGASAAAFYAAHDARVRGLVLLNPWVRTEQGQARATLRHYYSERLRNPEFWRKLACGGVRWMDSLRSLGRLARSANRAGASGELPNKLFQALNNFPGRILFILSGADLTAREFSAVAASTPGWRALMAAANVRHARIEAANHTFARAVWRDEVASLTADWIASW